MTTPRHVEAGVRVYCGDCRLVMPELPDGDCSVYSVVTDPPYHLTTGKKGGSGEASVNLNTPQGRARITTGFMGKKWDGGDVAHDPAVWRECLRLLKPGGYLLAFGGTRTYHRLMCAIEDAGFEIRDDIDFWYDSNPIFAAFYDSLSDEQKETLHQSAGASHLSWVYGSGFPKSLDVSKAIDAAAGAEREVAGTRFAAKRTSGNGSECFGDGIRSPSTAIVTLPATDAAKQWDGWGTALKPAHEPIVLARKPLIGTVAENVLQHGTGGLNIDGCRIETGAHDDPRLGGNGSWRTDKAAQNVYEGGYAGEQIASSALGRWPANVIHDGSGEVIAAFPDAPGQQRSASDSERTQGLVYSAISKNGTRTHEPREDSGSAARFFYCAKATQEDRDEGCEHLPHRVADTTHKRPRTELDDPRRHGVTPRQNHHPTVKPTDLMRYLVRLVTPPGGTVLDPFCGSGSTGKACALEQMNAILIDSEAEYCDLAAARSRLAQGLLAFG